ncbi:MAG: type II toxin-antitoxin system HicB family antitoxin [Clostridia bacterium]|nr:type II toxin-antitoxin system HicB family antitoxin [Clostridia bacterium]
MKQFVFPAVLYKDKENRGYTIILHDISVCTEGETVEEAFLRAKEFLETYCRCALEYNGEVEEATKYEDVEKEPNNIVLLVDAQIEGYDGNEEEKFSFNI